MNPDPLIVNVCPTDPAACCVGDSELIAGTGLLVTCCALLPPPQLGRRTRLRIIRPSIAPRLRPVAAIPIKQRPIMGSVAPAIHPIPRVTFTACRRNWPTGIVVIVMVVEPEAPMTCAGLKLQVVSAGSPEQLKLTSPLKPKLGNTCIVTGEDCPWVLVTPDVFKTRLKSGTLIEAPPESAPG
jgi:hypothetical protein